MRRRAENQMKKLIIKTICITLAVVVAASLAVYAFIAVFAPSALAGFYDKVGNYSLTIKYSEKAYESSHSFEDLAELCSALDEHSDAEKTVKYFTVFVNDEAFADYCLRANGVNGAMTAAEFYYGKLTVAEFAVKGADVAIERAAYFADKYGYTCYNPFYVLILDLGDKFDSSVKTKIKAAITEKYSALNEERKAFADRDLELLNESAS